MRGLYRLHVGQRLPRHSRSAEHVRSRRVGSITLCRGIGGTRSLHGLESADASVAGRHSAPAGRRRPWHRRLQSAPQFRLAHGGRGYCELCGQYSTGLYSASGHGTARRALACARMGRHWVESFRGSDDRGRARRHGLWCRRFVGFGGSDMPSDAIRAAEAVACSLRRIACHRVPHLGGHSDAFSVLAERTCDRSGCTNRSARGRGVPRPWPGSTGLRRLVLCACPPARRARGVVLVNTVGRSPAKKA